MVSGCTLSDQNDCYISRVNQTNKRVLGLGNKSGDHRFADFGFCYYPPPSALPFSLFPKEVRFNPACVCTSLHRSPSMKALESMQVE